MVLSHYHVQLLCYRGVIHPNITITLQLHKWEGVEAVWWGFVWRPGASCWMNVFLGHLSHYYRHSYRHCRLKPWMQFISYQLFWTYTSSINTHTQNHTRDDGARSVLARFRWQCAARLIETQRGAENYRACKHCKKINQITVLQSKRVWKDSKWTQQTNWSL